MYKNTDIIFVKTNYRGYIPALGQAGPIVNPLRCSVKDAISMIMGGMDLVQYDPKTKKTITLTLANVMDDSKFKPKPTISALEPETYGKETKVGVVVGVVKPRIVNVHIDEPTKEIRIEPQKVVPISPAVPVENTIVETESEETEAEIESNVTEISEADNTVNVAVSKKRKKKKGKKSSVEETSSEAATTEE